MRKICISDAGSWSTRTGEAEPHEDHLVPGLVLVKKRTWIGEKQQEPASTRKRHHMKAIERLKMRFGTNNGTEGKGLRLGSRSGLN